MAFMGYSRVSLVNNSFKDADLIKMVIAEYDKAPHMTKMNQELYEQLAGLSITLSNTVKRMDSITKEGRTIIHDSKD